MAEDIAKTQGEGESNTPNNEAKGSKVSESGKEKESSYTQEDIDKVAAKVRAEVTAKAEKEKEKAITEAKKEAERLAQLSAEEKEKEMMEKQEKELAEKEHNIVLRENKLEGIEKLSELKVPIKFIDFVLNTDKEKMAENIEILHKEWTEAVSAEVKSQLKGEAPKDPTSQTNKKESSEERTSYF